MISSFKSSHCEGREQITKLAITSGFVGGFVGARVGATGAGVGLPGREVGVAAGAVVLLDSKKVQKIKTIL